MGYLVLPGTTGNNATTPDAAPLRITGDIDIIARVDMNWDVAASKELINRGTGAAGGTAYRLNVLFDDKLTLRWWDGSGTNVESATVLPKTLLSPGTPAWVRGTLDVDNGAAGYDVKFYYSLDATNDHTAVSWTQLGTTITGGSTTSIAASAAGAPLSVGELATNAGGVLQQDWYRAVVKNGIGGTVEFDADFTTVTASEVSAGSFAEDSSNAATVTLNGATWTYVAAVVTGTAVAGGVLESEIVTGGETIILTLTDETWVATVGADNAITTALIAGIDSDGAEAAGWDAVVKANMVFGDVARTSDTVVTITLAAEATYAISADETITVTIPGTALTGGSEVVATPTFTVTNEVPAAPAAAATENALMAVGMAKFF